MESVISKKITTIAIIGNPNVGKSSIFNQLTGLKQKVGNYPGITVDKTVGTLKNKGRQYDIIDLPGTYSLYPKSEDELIAHRILSGKASEKPDYILMVLDACNLERSLLLAGQVMDLGIPVSLVLNMKDLAEKKGIKINTFQLYKETGVPIILTDARQNEGMDGIKAMIFEEKFGVAHSFLNLKNILPESLSEKIKQRYHLHTDFQAYQYLVFASYDLKVTPTEKKWLLDMATEYQCDIPALQIAETTARYKEINILLDKIVTKTSTTKRDLTQQIDNLMMHPILGYFFFLGLMLLIFQAIFAWAEWPMDLIDTGFAAISGWITETLPAGVFNDLLAEGIVPGIGGVVIFIPQIALLFGFLSFLEDTGYMSRVVYLMDRVMRPFGLHGKSVVPLISGMACAIPGIMASRSISNGKERLITILVTPWMSCSARLPVYIILIGLTVPDDIFLGINLQAIALLSMYLLSTAATLLAALVLKGFIKSREQSYLLTDLPVYRIPRWKAVLLTMYHKSKVFVLEAGKVILSISIVLWVLASYGPSANMDAIAQERSLAMTAASDTEIEELEDYYSSKKLENSYIGIVGKTIEPIIRPLGYDWKIGIALITSFAAREVFVGTIATIYSIGGDPDNEMTIREKLDQEVDPVTGEKVFNTATAFSLMVFYAFAMQCMSTLAIVYRETKSWKWPILQTVFMTAFAYLAAFITYQIIS
ncbi:ferrous iron transport protein B [Anditalea andensis]|uniref:Ferrous iron transport protein B n=1 Tax=Anditalea andensis TaxID=1048983 RepID=A0A074KTC6_9BACT|nr:ferrous iron transport protein B [Anditalea andensis]KEO72134.1 iron transporter FeoB [Anditalea andensis]